MKKYILSALCLGMMFTSCSDFLTEMPEYALTDKNAVTDASSAKNAVNGMYYKYEYSSALGGDLFCSLHCMAGLWDYNNTLYQMTQSQTSNTKSNIWKQLYSCINASNLAINGIQALDDSKFESVEEKNALLAEARCFRGFCNLQLLWYFSRWFDKADSPYGIIYRDKVAELSNLMTERLTVGESYEKVLEDLEFAEKNCKDYTSAKSVSKQFAQALHAKLLLIRNWDGDYKKSLDIVNDILNNGPASFKMESDLSELYNNGWNSSEVLFSRYLGDYSNYTYIEFYYSYALYYNNTFTEIPQKWLEDDERKSFFFGNARAPETWDTSRKDNVLTKLYHRGRYEGRNDMYSTMVFRYAELYLMKAELLARLYPNDIEGALAPINEMRAQYTNPVLDPIRGISNHQDLMDLIFKQYVTTLFMENDSPWFASLRFEKDGKPWINTLKPDVSVSEDKYCLPIPDEEITAHTNEIEQNPTLN